MALPAYPNAISLNAVNVELGRAATTTISLNDEIVRTLFVISSGAIAMSDGHGKSAATAPLFMTGTNNAVNDRTIIGYAYANMSGGAAGAGNAGTTSITASAATGGGITYEWQFLTPARFQGGCGGVSTPLVGSAQTWSGTGGVYNDSISGASTNVLTLNTHAYYGTSTYHGVAGYWRLKASNSAGTTYTGWTNVIKQWTYYGYSCNCACPAGQSYQESCNCSCPQQCQGTEPCNCNGCCTEVCNGCSCDCETIYTCACGCDCDNPPDVHYPGGQCFGCCEGCPQQGTCIGCCNCQNVDCTCDCSTCNTCSCADVCDTCTYCTVAEVCSTCYAYNNIDNGSNNGCSW